MLNIYRLKAHKPLISLILGIPASLPATELSTGFGAEYNHSVEVSGQNDWSIDDPTANLTFFVRLNGSDAAAFGGFYDIPAGPETILSHPVGIPLAGASLQVSLAFLSSTSLYPGTDSFGWSLNDPAGNNLFTLRFVPVTGTPGSLEITWSTGAGPQVSTNRTISYSAPCTLDLKFDAAGAVNTGFTVAIAGATSFSFSSSLSGLAGSTWNSVSAHFIVGGAVCGDDFMIFDNLSATSLPKVDADGDGYSAEEEAWFGTSDDNCLSCPAPMLSFTDGIASFAFPSVAGNDYYVESSDDLLNWTPTLVTATGSTTGWQQADSSLQRLYFRVRKP
jgi:hypothetical protein